MYVEAEHSCQRIYFLHLQKEQLGPALTWMICAKETLGSCLLKIFQAQCFKLISTEVVVIDKGHTKNIPILWKTTKVQFWNWYCGKGFTFTKVDMTAAHPFSALIKYSFLELQENTDETISLHCFMKILHSHKTYRDSLQYTCCFRQHSTGLDHIYLRLFKTKEQQKLIAGSLAFLGEILILLGTKQGQTKTQWDLSVTADLSVSTWILLGAALFKCWFSEPGRAVKIFNWTKLL